MGGHSFRTEDEQFTIVPMFDREIETKFINTRGAAIAALFVAMFLVGSRFWSLIKHRPPTSGWIYPVNSWLPNWLAITGNRLRHTGSLCFSSLACVLREPASGTERVILAIMVAETLVSPIRQFVPAPLAEALLRVQAFGNLVMFLGTVHLFLHISERQSGS